jgi:hypothetical protein
MRVAIIDTETGGLDERRHGLTQVAAIDGVLHVTDGRVCFATRSTFHEFIAPDPTFEYDEEALKYQGVTLDFLKENGGNIVAMLARLSTFMDPIVALGPGRVWAQEDTFDFKFIHAAMLYNKELGNDDQRYYDWAGVKNLHRGRKWDRSNWQCSKRLARLCRSVGLLNSDGDSLEPVCKALGIQRPTISELKPVQDCWMTGQAIAAMLTTLGMAGHPYYLDR